MRPSLVVLPVMRTGFVLLALTAVLAPAAIAGADSPPAPQAGVVVRTGTAPCGVAARSGSLWVGVYGAGRLLEIDATTGRVEATVAVGRWACRVAVGPRAVWVTRDRAGELVRASRGTGRLRRLTVGAGAFDVLLAHGSVWATSFDIGAIVSIDARTRRFSRLYKDGPNPAGLTSCAGRIWVGHGRATTWVTSIDPATHRIRRIEVDAPAPAWPTCIGGVVWVTTPETVVRIDPTSGRVLSRLRLGGTLADTTEAPDGLVWVTDKEHAVVRRVTPDGSSIVDSFPAGPGAFALARTGSSMWVTSFAGSDVRRYGP